LRTHTDEFETLSVGTVSTPGGFEVDMVGDLSHPHNLDVHLVSEGNCPSVAILDGRFGDNIRCPTQRMGS
jgi:hypothetical protein